MPHRFPAAGALIAPQYPAAANDNPPARTGQDFARGALLRDALRHFAAHGAGAAEHARARAEHAFFAGRRREYLHWMGICRALDRQLVEAARAASPRLG